MPLTMYCPMFSRPVSRAPGRSPLAFSILESPGSGRQCGLKRGRSNSSNPFRLSRPWSCADPYLYDLLLELVEGRRVIDSVKSYAGLRKFHIEGNKFYLNNKP